MDFRDEVQVGQHTYGVTAKSQPAHDDQPASVAVEFTGADSDGQVIAEGNLLIALNGLLDSGSFLTQTLEGLGALHGQRKRTRGARARSGPPNAGQPWTEEHSEQLTRSWLQHTATTSAHEVIGELANELGRTRGAVRAQLARLGCDPDVPGRALADAADP